MEYEWYAPLTAVGYCASYESTSGGLHRIHISRFKGNAVWQVWQVTEIIPFIKDYVWYV